MKLPVHYELHGTDPGDRAPHQDPDRGLNPRLLKALSNPALSPSGGDETPFAGATSKQAPGPLDDFRISHFKF